jgi:predicted metallopeptidase
MDVLNLTAELERLISHIAASHPAFAHVDPARLLVCVTTTRTSSPHGVFAKIHPLRFPGGSRSQQVRRGRRTYLCTMPSIAHGGREMLYVIYFMVPRFMDRPLRDKLITVFHELYHISPSFDGDIRRFPGRNYAHGGSTRQYNKLMEQFVDEYLLHPESAGHTAFLSGDMDGLRSRHRAVVGRKMPMPRIRVEPCRV